MAQLLFRLNRGKTAVIHEEAAKLCPELAKIDGKQLLLIILWKDYASPYHQLPESERLLRAKRHVYGTSDVKPEEQKEVVAAVEAYMSLQYDPIRETLKNYREKIIRLSNKILDEEQPAAIGKLNDAIAVLNKSAAQFEAELNKLMSNEEELKGGQTLSYIEKWQANQREFNKRKQKAANESPAV